MTSSIFFMVIKKVVVEYEKPRADMNLIEGLTRANGGMAPSMSFNGDPARKGFAYDFFMEEGKTGHFVDEMKTVEGVVSVGVRDI